MPELAKGLEQLLQFKGDVESTFALSFEVEYDYFGEMRSHELRPGGSKVRLVDTLRTRCQSGIYCAWRHGAAVE